MRSEPRKAFNGQCAPKSNVLCAKYSHVCLIAHTFEEYTIVTSAPITVLLFYFVGRDVGEKRCYVKIRQGYYYYNTYRATSYHQVDYIR